MTPKLPARLAAVVVLTSLAACATFKKHPDTGHAASTHKATPSPTPAPAPTPEARYTATVRIEGGETTEQDVTPKRPSPSPSPSPSPTPAAKKPAAAAPLVFIGSLWQKIFPPKKSPVAVATAPTVTPGPREGLFARTWHRIFPRKQAPPVAAPPQWVGTIKLVNEREGYALIDASNSPTLGPGETLNAIGNDEESGVLRTTNDRNPPFFIADLVSGKPRAGDRVYSPTPQKTP